MSPDMAPGMEQSSALRVAIIGGGIGGLAAAVCLHRAGLQVSVYERDRCFGDRKQGYGLTLINNPKGPLAHLGLLDECVARDCASNCHYVFKPDGEVLGYYGTAFKQHRSAKADICTAEGCSVEASTSGGGSSSNGKQTVGAGVCRGNLRVPRQDLRQMLLDRLPPGTVCWGWRLLDYEERVQEQDVQLSFEVLGNSNNSSGSSSGLGEPVAGDKAAGASSAPKRRTVEADVVVGADGLRSVLRRLRDERLAAQGDDTSPLKYVGVSVILGLTTAEHPHIHRRGFYVVDGTHRLFTMPFREAEEVEVEGADGSGERQTERRPPLTMWQLSFSDVTEEQGLQLRSMTPAQLLEEAARRTAHWMEPVPDMIRCTPAGEVWGTPLYDRDPMHVYSKRSGGAVGKSRADSRITLLGDAAHPMSMFKGQGANQALEDGPLLTSWLSKPGLRKDNVATRLRCFEREMVSRAASKMHASRAAAKQLHSPAVMEERFGVEGVTSQQCDQVLAHLRAKGLGASAGADLDDHMRATIAVCVAAPAAQD